MLISDLPFAFVGPIQPDRDARGNIITFMPQANYVNSENRRLHQYGGGPFCKFRLHTDCGEGVYAFVVERDVAYVGECEDLASRFNSGYGNISPRNCFEGGQPTNCRVNALVLRHSASGQDITLWFHPTANRKEVEAQLLRAVAPPWNRAGVVRSSARIRTPTAKLPFTFPIKRPLPDTDTSRDGPASVHAAPSGQTRDRSRVEKPVRLVWSVAEEMVGVNPNVSSRDVVDECVRRGVARNTAKTQYSLWKTLRRG
jgi:hypothetical protein